MCILVVKFFWLVVVILFIIGILSLFSLWLMLFNFVILFSLLYLIIIGFIVSWLIGIVIGVCWDWIEVKVGVVFWVDEFGLRVRVLCNFML